MKRYVDISISFLAILLLLPLLIVIGLVVFFETKKSPVYIQKRRLTYEHPVFNCYKFRTMYQIPEQSEHISHNVTLKNEFNEYITWFGQYLRKSGLDELPQLLNILRGDMSFIGPRPLQISDVDILKNSFPTYYKKRTMILSRPGITGYWQVFGDRFQGVQNLVDMDIEYENRKSLSLDLKIILKTVSVILLVRHFDACNYKNSDKLK